MSYRITGVIDLARLVLTCSSTPSPVAIGYCVPPYPNGDDGVAQPTVHADLRPGWTQYDLTDLSQRAQRLRLEVLAQREFCAPFELSHDAPLRITVVRTAVPTNTCCCCGPPHRLG